MSILIEKLFHQLGPQRINALIMTDYLWEWQKNGLTSELV